jgi:hypothetical protein
MLKVRTVIRSIDDASRASFGRPDPLGPASVAPLTSSDDLTAELARIAQPAEAGAHALQLLARRVARSRELGLELPLIDAFDACALGDDDRRLLGACIAAGLAGDEVTVSHLGDLVGRRVVADRLEPRAPLLRLQLVTVVGDDVAWPARRVVAARRLFALAWGARALDGDVAAQLVATAQPPIDGDLELLADACRRTSRLQPVTLVRGVERDDDLVERIARVAATLGKRTLLVDGAVAARQLGALAREALVLDAVVVVCGGDARVHADLAGFDVPVALVASEALPQAAVVELPPLSADERVRELADAPAPAGALLRDLRLGPATLRRVLDGARAGDDAGASLHASLAALWPLPPLARVVAPPRSWDELQVPQMVGEAIVAIVAHARRGSDGQVVSCTGVAGSGKTMMSALLAHDLGLPLREASLRLLLAAARAGARDLRELIRCAEEGGALVALEDADAVSATDEGPAALDLVRWLARTRATVLLHSRGSRPLDPALARLVAVDVPFGALDQPQRVQVWLQALGELADDARALAATPATGGEIVAWAARARSLAAFDGEPVSLQHVRQVIDQARGASDGTR